MVFNLFATILTLYKVYAPMVHYILALLCNIVDCNRLYHLTGSVGFLLIYHVVSTKGLKKGLSSNGQETKTSGFRVPQINLLSLVKLFCSIQISRPKVNTENTEVVHYKYFQKKLGALKKILIFSI